MQVVLHALSCISVELLSLGQRLLRVLLETIHLGHLVPVVIVNRNLASLKQPSSGLNVPCYIVLNCLTGSIHNFIRDLRIRLDLLELIALTGHLEEALLNLVRFSYRKAIKELSQCVLITDSLHNALALICRLASRFSFRLSNGKVLLLHIKRSISCLDSLLNFSILALNLIKLNLHLDL